LQSPLEVRATPTHKHDLVDFQIRAQAVSQLSDGALDDRFRMGTIGAQIHLATSDAKLALA